MSLVNKLQSTEVSPRAVLLSIVVLVVATAGVLTAVVKLMNAPAPARGSREAGLPSVSASTAPAVARDPDNTSAAQPAKADYGIIVKRNLFRPIRAAAIAPPPPLPPVEPPVKPPARKPEPVPPFKPLVNPTPTTPPVTPPRLAYTGVVEVGGDTYALIEHLDTREAQYVRKGGMAFECTVVEITPVSVAIEHMGAPFTLNLGENKIEETAPPPAAQSGNQSPGSGQPPAARPSGGPQPPSGGRTEGREGRIRFNRGNGENPRGNPAGGG